MKDVMFVSTPFALNTQNLIKIKIDFCAIISKLIIY